MASPGSADDGIVHYYWQSPWIGGILDRYPSIEPWQTLAFQYCDITYLRLAWLLLSRTVSVGATRLSNEQAGVMWCAGIVANIYKLDYVLSVAGVMEFGVIWW